MRKKYFGQTWRVIRKSVHGDPIKNQQFCNLQFRGTGWSHEQGKSAQGIHFKKEFKTMHFLSRKISRRVQSILRVESILIVESILWFKSILRFDQLWIFHSHDQRLFSYSYDQRNMSYSQEQWILSYSHYQQNFQSKMKESTYQMTRTQKFHRQTRHQRKINAIRRRRVVKTGKITRHTHLWATVLILPMTVIIDARDEKKRNIGKTIQSNNAQL